MHQHHKISYPNCCIYLLSFMESSSSSSSLVLSMQSLVSLVVGGFLLLLLWEGFSLFWLSPSRKLRRLRKSGFSGPPPVFPLGNLKEMAKSFAGNTAMAFPGVTHDIHSFVLPYFAQWRKTYGKVFVYWLGTEPFLYAADPEFLRRTTSGVLGKKWGKPDVFKHESKPMFGRGLVSIEGDDWARQRHIIAPAIINMSNLNSMVGQMEESSHKMVNQWSLQLVATAAGQWEVDVAKDVTKNAAEIIAKTSFGIDDETGKKVLAKLQALQSLLFESINPFAGVPFSTLLNTKRSYDAWRLGKEIDALLLETVASRINSEATAAAGRRGARHDLLQLLIAENAKFEKKLKVEELVDQSKTFFFGGYETMALAISWTMLLLAVHPEWQTALRQEVVEEIPIDTPIDCNMLSRLTKMGWVFNEVMRLYSPAPNQQRQAREDIPVGGGAVVIPKGTNMWVDVVGLHHDPELWGDDVFEFRPERWQKDELYGGCRHRMGYLPFGFGERMCVGRNLAVLEYKIVLALVLRRFSLAPSPAYAHAPRVMLSLRSSHGVHLMISLLHEAY